MTMAEDSAGEGRRRGTILLAALALAGTAVIAVLVWQAMTTGARRDDAIAQQRQSYGVMILARELDATLGGAEATLGRFVISGDKSIGQTYADNWRRAGTLLDRLGQQANPAVRAQVDELRAAYSARGAELGTVALSTTYKQNDQALSKYYAAGRSPTLARLKTAVDRLILSERATLERRSAETEQTISRSNFTVTILSIAGVLLALAAGLLGLGAWLGLARRRQEEARNLELEDAVRFRTAELREANAALVNEMAEREAAEARLRQGQKLEAIGQLAGGIAHDFNNMLAVVVSGLELAQRRLAGENREVVRHLDRAMEGAVRAAALTKRLLAFARAEPILPAPVDPRALIANMVELLDRTLGDTIGIAIEDGPCATVFVDAHQLENALLNLAVNARDAMPDGGTLAIATENCLIGEDGPVALPPGAYVRIAVRDTGTGMDAATIERAFDPFFTTKRHGQGTGLGLSQAFGFVRQSGGTIAIESAPGAGTTVSLYLPRSEGADAAPVSDRSAPAPLPLRAAGRPTLVIEDDPRVLAATVEALRELGFEPLACAGPAEVPVMLRARRDIGLIVSDVLMPGVTGPALVAAIRTVLPEVPVLFMTGFAGDIEDPAQFDGHEVLRKPFTIDALAAALDRVLATAREPAIEQAKAA